MKNLTNNTGDANGVASKAWLAAFDALPPVPAGHEFALCPQCNSLLCLSKDRYPRALCGCGFWGVPRRIDKAQAEAVFAANKHNGY